MSDVTDAILVGRSLLAECPNILETRLPAHSLSASSDPKRSRGVLVFEETSAQTGNVQQAVRLMAAQMKGINDYPISVVHVPAHLAQIIVGEDGGLKAPDRIMRSILRRYETSADIRLLDNLNACWRRFAVCKELAHLIMGEGHGTRAVSIDQQIEMALAITRNPRPGQSLSSEEFAWFAAMEMLLPREDHQELLDRWAQGEQSLDIARSYWVPKAIVDMFFETQFVRITTGIK